MDSPSIYYLERASKYKKYGAPITATTIPAGISDGWIIQRPIVSAINTSNAPASAAPGIKY